MISGSGLIDESNSGSGGSLSDSNNISNTANTSSGLIAATPTDSLQGASEGGADVGTAFGADNQGAMLAVDVSSNPPIAPPDGRNDELQRHTLMLRQQQQRLLLLRHAYKCPHANGSCPITRFCAGIKQLWGHISACQNKRCTVPHCLSSRVILAHYHGCKDAACAVCAPVRNAIQQSQRKAQQLTSNSASGSGRKRSKAGEGATDGGTRGRPRKHKSSSPGHGDLAELSFSGSDALSRSSSSSSSSSSTGGGLKFNPHAGCGHHPSLTNASGAAVSGPLGPPVFEKPRTLSLGPLAIPPDNSPVIDRMSEQELSAHLASLDTSNELKKRRVKAWALPLHRFLWESPNGFWFHRKVDPVKLDLPGYWDVVKKPMDLTTMRKRLESNKWYTSLEAFASDARLMLHNAMLYNEAGTDVHAAARDLLAQFEVELSAAAAKADAEIAALRKTEGVCPLCVNASLKFEPVTYYCQGSHCAGRLRRNAKYACCGDYRWCLACFAELPEHDPIEVGGGRLVLKQSLEKRKNDEVNEEPWAYCDGCERWVHQICSLFNSRRNTSEDQAYVCPLCVVKRKKLQQLEAAKEKEKGAAATDEPTFLASEERAGIFAPVDTVIASIAASSPAGSADLTSSAADSAASESVPALESSTIPLPLSVEATPIPVATRQDAGATNSAVTEPSVDVASMEPASDTANTSKTMSDAEMLTEFVQPLLSDTSPREAVGEAATTTSTFTTTVSGEKPAPAEGNCDGHAAKEVEAKAPAPWLGPAELPKSKLSDFLEAGVAALLDKLCASPTALLPPPLPLSNSSAAAPNQTKDGDSAARASSHDDARRVASSEFGDRDSDSEGSEGSGDERAAGGGVDEHDSDDESVASRATEVKTPTSRSMHADSSFDFSASKLSDRSHSAIDASQDSLADLAVADKAGGPPRKRSKTKNTSSSSSGSSSSSSSSSQWKAYSNDFELAAGERPNLTIRVVADCEKTLAASPRLRARYSTGVPGGDYPAEFPFRSKCIMLFQKIHGVEVALFVMFVYECGDECPEPNRNRAYISYLDSVNYFRPKHLRTLVYHEVLTKYMEFIKLRGFRSCHIWACPPLRGDDYVLFCHPEDQKIPREERLTAWYAEMLNKAKTRGIVTNVATIFDAYMKAPVGASAAASPEPSGSAGNGGSLVPNSDSSATGQVAKIPYFEGDYWVGEIEAIIEGCEKAEGDQGKAPWKPPIAVARADSLISRKKAQMAATVPPPRLPTRSSQGAKDESEPAPSLDPVMVRLRAIFEPMKNSFFVATLQDSDTNDAPAPLAVSASQFAPATATATSVNSPIFSVGAIESSENSTSRSSSSSSSSINAKGIDESMTASSSTRASWSPSTAPTTPVALSVVGAGGVRRALRADPDRVAENDLCDSRQSFLNACQAQHLQFDQLRRAKHSTTMLCYALHNPTAPPASTTTNDDDEGAEGAASGTQGGAASAAGDTAERRAARQQSIQLHMKLLLHTSSCRVNPCPSQNCRKMKRLLSHSEVCPARANKKGCQICRRVYALLHMHARDCRDEQCAVLHCRAFRERGRQIRRQQNQVRLLFSIQLLPFICFS